MVRQLSHYPVLCIEGDEYFFSLLEKNLASQKDVELVHAFVGESNEEVRGEFRNKSGTGNVVRRPDRARVFKFSSLSDILKRYPAFSGPKLVKIDTDGFDLKILRGAADILRSAKPILFFEYDPFFLSQQGDDGVSIFPFLRDLGYERILFYDNFGDFMFSARLDNDGLFEEVHSYFSGRGGESYCDLCVFHQEDSDLALRIRDEELKYFKSERQTVGIHGHG